MDNWDDIYLRTNDKHAALLNEAKQSRLLHEGSHHHALLISAIILIGMISWWVR